MKEIVRDLVETLRKLSSLEQRTNDVSNYVLRVEIKIDNLLDRLSKLEEKYENLRQNVKNEILADIKADVARVQTILNHQVTQNLNKKTPGRISSKK